MHLRAQPIRLLNCLPSDVSCLLLGDLQQLLHSPAESREVGLSSSSVGLVNGLAELTVVGHQ
jgi:hypothetical protein